MFSDSQRKWMGLNSAILAVFGVWMFWTSGTELRAARDRYDALGTAPIVAYQVAGRSSLTEGSGKSRKTTWFLQLAQQYPAPGAPRRIEVKVDDDVHDRSRDGEIWQARMDAGQPVFDPARTDYEAGMGRTRRGFGLGLGLLGIVLFVLHRSGRLYRPLF